MGMKKPVYKVCETCGSFDVQCDAYASWNPVKQTWELSELFQQEYCSECDGETNVTDLHEGDTFVPDPAHGKPFQVAVVDGWPEAWTLEPVEDPWGIGDLVWIAAFTKQALWAPPDEGDR
jgi:hypothetical protein